MKKLIDFYVAEEEEINKRINELEEELGVKMSFTGYVNYCVNQDLSKEK